MAGLKQCSGNAESIKVIKMEKLLEFIAEHSTRSTCTCGKCIDASGNPKDVQPEGHTIDMEFFKVSLKNKPKAKVLHKLIEDNPSGAFADIDLFDGKDHNFMEINRWIGDKNNAIILMGMGDLLGLWEAFTPTKLGVPPLLAKELAGQGLVFIKSD